MWDGRHQYIFFQHLYIARSLKTKRLSMPEGLIYIKIAKFIWRCIHIPEMKNWNCAYFLGTTYLRTMRKLCIVTVSKYEVSRIASYIEQRCFYSTKTYKHLQLYGRCVSCNDYYKTPLSLSYCLIKKFENIKLAYGDLRKPRLSHDKISTFMAHSYQNDKPP